MANQSKMLDMECEPPPWNRVALKLHHCLSQFYMSDLTNLLPKHNPWMMGAHRGPIVQDDFITFREFEAHLDALHIQMLKEKILPDNLSPSLQSYLTQILKYWHNIIYYYPKNQQLIEVLELDYDLSDLDDFLQHTTLDWLFDFLQLNFEAKTAEVNEQYCELINPFIRGILDKALFSYADNCEHLKYTQWVLEHQLNTVVGFARKAKKPHQLYNEYDATEESAEEKTQAPSSPSIEKKKKRKKHKSDKNNHPKKTQPQPIAQTTIDDSSRSKNAFEIFNLLLAYLDIDLTENEDAPLHSHHVPEIDNRVNIQLEHEDVSEVSTENEHKTQTESSSDIESEPSIDTSNFNWLMEEGALLVEVKEAEKQNQLRQKWVLMNAQYAQLKQLKTNQKTVNQYQDNFTDPNLYYHSMLIKEPYKITHALLRHKIVKSLSQKEYHHELIIDNDDKKQCIWDTINDVLLSETLLKFRHECLDPKVLELIELQVTSQRHKGRSSHAAVNELVYANYISVEDRLACINSVKAQLDSAQSNDIDFKRMTPLIQIIQSLFPWGSHYESLSKYIGDKLFRKLYIKLRIIEENETIKFKDDVQTLEFIKFKLEETCGEKEATPAYLLADLEEACPNPILFKKTDNALYQGQNACKRVHWQEPLIKLKGP